MPSLERVNLSTPKELTPEDSNRPIAVSRSGQILFPPTRRQADTVLTLLDSTGGLVQRLGRRGHGPGELMGANELRFADGLPLVLDLEQGRVVKYHSDGAIADEFTIPVGYWLLGVTSDSLDWMHRLSGPAAELLRSSQGGSGGRVLIARTDSFLQAVTAGNRATSQDIPAYATDGDRSVLGDGMLYELQYYDATGNPVRHVRRGVEPRLRTPRELEVASDRVKDLMAGGFKGPKGFMAIGGLEETLDSLKSTPIPHFSRHGLWFDEKGRLWVIGEANDSTFADVFADTTFLGRLMVPCRESRGSVALSGHWLALLCASDAGGDFDGELQLYRILEPGVGAPSAQD